MYWHASGVPLIRHARQGFDRSHYHTISIRAHVESHISRGPYNDEPAVVTLTFTFLLRHGMHEGDGRDLGGLLPSCLSRSSSLSSGLVGLICRESILFKSLGDRQRVTWSAEREYSIHLMVKFRRQLTAILDRCSYDRSISYCRLRGLHILPGECVDNPNHFYRFSNRDDIFDILIDLPLCCPKITGTDPRCRFGSMICSADLRAGGSITLGSAATFNLVLFCAYAR